MSLAIFARSRIVSSSFGFMNLNCWRIILLQETLTDISSFLQGKLYVRGDSKIFRFQNGKTESLFLQRKNPRRIAWTVLFRRQHKKGITEVRQIALLLDAPSSNKTTNRKRPRNARAAQSNNSAVSSVPHSN